MRYSSFDQQTGITKTTSLNIGKEYQWSVNVNFSTKITPKWNLFTNGSLRYTRVTNNADASQSNSGFGCNFNMNTNYKFSDKFTVGTFLGLWQEPRTIQTRYPFNTWHNVSFNYKVFHDKLLISVRAVNYFEKERAFKNITQDANFYNTTSTTRPRRAGVLALTWNFGKLTENVSKKKGVNNDDLLGQPAAPTGN